MQLAGLFRSAARLALLLHAVVELAPVEAAETTRIESSRHGDVVDIRATADLAADRGTAWRVLTDYGSYTAFIPGLRESRVVARSGTRVIVEQVGSAALGPLRIPLEITFEIEESPPHGLESRAIAGTLRSLESRYTLELRPSGSRLLYAGRVHPGFPLFGSLGQSAIEDNVGRQFRALVEEIEHRGRSDAPSSSDARR